MHYYWHWASHWQAMSCTQRNERRIARLSPQHTNVYTETYALQKHGSSKSTVRETHGWMERHVQSISLPTNKGSKVSPLFLVRFRVVPKFLSKLQTLPPVSQPYGSKRTSWPFSLQGLRWRKEVELMTPWPSQAEYTARICRHAAHAHLGRRTWCYRNQLDNSC
jgi:hypothetical protein